jgi:hypothetical protein
MTLIEGNPALDPGIQLPAQRSTDAFTIRAVEPPVCNTPREPVRTR